MGVKGQDRPDTRVLDIPRPYVVTTGVFIYKNRSTPTINERVKFTVFMFAKLFPYINVIIMLYLIQFSPTIYFDTQYVGVVSSPK